MVSGMRYENARDRRESLYLRLSSSRRTLKTVRILRAFDLKSLLQNPRFAVAESMVENDAKFIIIIRSTIVGRHGVAHFIRVVERVR